MTRSLRISIIALCLLVASIAFVRPNADPVQTEQALAASAISTLMMTIAPPAQAQERKRRSLFKIIFGKNRANRKAVKRRSLRRDRRARRNSRRNRRATSRRTRRSNRTRRAAVASAPEPQAVEKIKDAKVVLVVGDFYAGNLASGLERRLADVAGVVVSDKAVGLSGLVRTDITDWPSAIPGLVEEVKPAYIVFMVGANDRQMIRDTGQRIKKRTPEWDAEYKSRVEAVGKALKATKLPYTWVGLPPVRFKGVNTDWLYFNELYSAAAAGEEQGKFVDVWDGFSDADGNYTRSGPDVNGQIVLLRGKDGINLTRAGRQRLAFYVETDIRKAFDGETPSAAALAGIGAGVQQEQSPESVYDPRKTGRTVVISLSDTAVDGDSVLAGETVDVKLQSLPLPETTPEAPVQSASARRVDNYVWPPQPATAPPAQPSAVAGTPEPVAAQ